MNNFRKCLEIVALVLALALVFMGCSNGSTEELIIPTGANLAEKLSWIKTNVKNGGTYEISLNANETIGGVYDATPDLTSKPNYLDYGGKTVKILLKGDGSMRTVSIGAADGNLFWVSSGVTFVLGNNITLHGKNNNNSPVIFVDESGVLEMNSNAVITGNTFTGVAGGGVVVYKGSFKMSGGTITNNIGEYGGGVNINNGTFIMSSGTISGNEAKTHGGGVLVCLGTNFEMSGGTISGNFVSNGDKTGGGVYLWNEAIFTMTGGTISSNQASINGGGVYLITNSVFNLNSSLLTSIHSNTNSSGPQQIYVNSDSTIKIDGNAQPVPYDY